MGWQIVGLCLSCLQKGCAVDKADLFRVSESQVHRIWETAATPKGIVEEWRSDVFAGAFLQFVSVPCNECACIVDPPLKELPLNTGQRRSERLPKVELPAVKAEMTAKAKGQPKQKPPPKQKKPSEPKPPARLKRDGTKQESKPKAPKVRMPKVEGAPQKRPLEHLLAEALSIMTQSSGPAKRGKLQQAQQTVKPEACQVGQTTHTGGGENSEAVRTSGAATMQSGGDTQHQSHPQPQGPVQIPVAMPIAMPIPAMNVHQMQMPMHPMQPMQSIHPMQPMQPMQQFCPPLSNTQPFGFPMYRPY